METKTIDFKDPRELEVKEKADEIKNKEPSEMFRTF